MSGRGLLRIRSLADAYEEVGRHAPGFDTLRAVAASAVVLHHATGLSMDLLAGDPLFAFSRGYTTIGFFAVSFFFCISGFLVTPGLAANGDWIGYLSRRFMRIVPLLAVVVAATALVIGPLATRLPLETYFSDPQSWSYFRNITTSLSLELPGVVTQEGTNRVNEALWTLRYEVLCYLLLAALAILGLLARRWLVLILWLAASTLTAVTFETQGAQSSQFFNLAHLFAYFGAGVLLYLFAPRVPVSAGLAMLAAILLAAVLWLGLGAVFAPPLTAYLCVALGLVRFPWSDRAARFDISYGIYLWHGPVMAMLIEYNAFADWRTFFVATMGATVVLSALSWTFVEAPSLARKTWPADLFRNGLVRLRGISRSH